MVQLLRKTVKFSWDDKCEEIFKQMKDFLTSPSVIQKPRPDQPILVYLAVGGGNQCCLSVGGRERGTTIILRQPDASCGRDEVLDDRKGGVRPSPHNKEDAPLLPKSFNHCKD